MIQNFAKKQTGFTLVELLVVIAIIGLLSTIVVVSFGAVRDRARDTAIRANMASIRLAAELQWGAANTYVNVNARTDFIAANNAIAAAGGALTGNTSVDSYCFRSNLPGAGGGWCIDSAGRIGNALAAGCSVNAPHNCI